jgi:hypothetical protein
VADRTELNDLAEKQPERVAKMSDVWHAWAEEVELKVKK